VMIAGLGLSMILIHSLGGSLLLGFNSGYSTYASRAFGANSRTKFNNYIIQGALNLFVLLLLLTVLGMLTYRLCIITGQQADVAYEAYRFYVWQLPGLWCYFIADFLRNQLSAQAIFKPLNYANAFCCIFHVVISSFLSPRYGFYGIVLSTNLTFIFLLVLVILTLQRNSKWPLDKTVYDPQQWNEGYSEFFY
jgi:Na+-driven multidrug efflux pump